MKEENRLSHIFDMSLFNVNDLDTLLHEVLKQTREILDSQAGSIYICEEDALSFNIFQNDAMSYEEIYKQFYSIKDLKLPLSEQEKYLAVKSFITKKIIIIDDVYDAKEYDFFGVKEFDKKFNYRTHSIITTPLIHPIDQKTIGVLQLINKLENGKTTVFNEKDKQILSIVSSFISLSIVNAQNNMAKLKRINDELEIANDKLKIKVEEEIRESQSKSSIIFHQSKLISMGEMIGNIAHQWRQPLSAISTLSSGLSFHIELGNYNEKDAMKSLRQVVDITQHLSKTIDDFRDFYKLDKKKNSFNIAKTILSSIIIIESSLREYNIEIIRNFDTSIEIYGYENEFKQAILNLIENAKYALIKNNKDGKKRFIFIDLEKDENFVYLKFKDNAKGVDTKIIDKIFEQNFTTKEENNEGTGLGLFMTKQIIQRNMNGIIKVSNQEYTYCGKEYLGAEFLIRFNLNNNKNHLQK